MANKFAITITAVDQATPVIKGVNASIAKITRPITDFNKSAERAFKEFTSNSLIRGVKGFGIAVGDTVKAVGGLAPETSRAVGVIGEVAAAAGEGAGALGVFGGAALGLGAALTYATMKFASLGFGIKQASINLGLSTTNVQTWRMAAGAMGVDAQTADASMQSLGDTIQGATYGRNQQALVFMNRLGIALKRTKTGAIDVNDEMLQFSTVIQRFNGQPQIQRLIAQQFGLEGVLPVLRQGRQALEAQMAYDRKFAPSDDDINRANKLEMSLKRIKVLTDSINLSNDGRSNRGVDRSSRKNL